MPYVDDLPQPVRAHLPLHAQEIYLAAFARTEYTRPEVLSIANGPPIASLGQR
jgi:hypothetical protein